MVIQRDQSLYSGTEAVVEWQGRSSQPVPIGRGLRQGCPLSPLLFMLLLCDLEGDLQESGRGFDLSYMEGGEVVHQRLPGLLHADDILLTANSRVEHQELLDICSRHANWLGLRFSPRKCAVLQVLDRGPLRLQGELIQVVSSYCYLGVVVSTEPDYLRQHEQRTKEKAVLGQNVLKAKALWSFNRLEVLRGLWKAVSVPALTFANSVLCPSAATREFLERRQREVGRMALGCHRTTLNEAVQGDVGRASFETSEAIAKLCFCGAEEESVEHVGLACPQLQPAKPSGLTLEQALGFWPALPPGSAAVASDVASEVNRAGAGGAVQIRVA